MQKMKLFKMVCIYFFILLTVTACYEGSEKVDASKTDIDESSANDSVSDHSDDSETIPSDSNANDSVSDNSDSSETIPSDSNEHDNSSDLNGSTDSDIDSDTDSDSDSAINIDEPNTYQNLRRLINPEYSYTDNFEESFDSVFWYKKANSKFQGIDPEDESNHVMESMYGSPGAIQRDGDSSELNCLLPVKAVQLEFGFREYTPKNYVTINARNHKTVGAYSGAYGVYNSNIAVCSEGWVKPGGATPSIYTGYDGSNRGHFNTPGNPLLWEEGDGNWHDVHVFIQLAERPGEYGFYEMYRDGELLITNRLEGDYYKQEVHVNKLLGFATRGNFLDHVRLHGWANKITGTSSAYPEPTHFLYDDFYLYANSVHGKTSGGTELDNLKEEANVVYEYDFSNNSAPIKVNGLSYGSQNGGTMDFSNGYLSAYYPAVNGTSNWWNMSVLDQNTSEVYIEFDARMPNAKHGFKFLKIFGEKDANDSSNYCNVTFGLDYTGIDNGGMLCVAFGDGSQTDNDTDNLIWLDGRNPAATGRSYDTSAHVVTPQNKSFSSHDWGNNWHHFKIYWKFDQATSPEEEINHSDNKKNGISAKANGACYLEIDGKPYVVATGLLNRHILNSLKIDKIALADWTQKTGDTLMPEFTIEYDNIVVSTGGFK